MGQKVAWVVAAALAAVATGASAQTRGVSKTEITLGMHTDLSGVAATYGVSSSNAVKLRFDEINDSGGINGRKIRLIVEDNGYQVPKAVQACNKLINRDKVFAFVGALGTPMNNACFKDQLAAEVPNLFPLSAARSMFEPFHRLKFYNAATYVDQLRSAVNYFVKEKGKKAVCVMYQDTDYGKEILDGAEQQAKKLNVKLVETTPGRMLIAHLPPEDLRERLGDDPLPKVTGQSPGTHARLAEILAADLERGCAWSFSAFEPGIDSCAAPVCDASGEVIAAISVAGPQQRFEADGLLRERTEKEVKAAARDLSALLGYRQQ